jgi:hypothetical protein
VDNAQVCVNDVVTLSANITGGSGSYQYQWQQSPDGVGSWSSIGGATNATYNPITSAPGLFYYRVILTDVNAFCDNPTSAAASVEVFQDATASVGADNSEVCLNDAVTLTANVSGGSGSFTYVWQQSTNGVSGWVTISGATNSTYVPITSSAGVLYYRVIVNDTNAFCANPISSATSVTVYQDATVSAGVDNAAVCLNDAVSISANVTGGSGAYTYVWQQSADGVGGWTNIGGATSSTYAPSTNTAGTLYYRVIVTDANSLCASPTSAAASVTVYEDAAITASANNAEVCLNDAVTINSNITGGSGSYSYQWQQSPNGSTGWTNISGATNASYNPATNVVGTLYYRILLNDNNAFCADPNSSAVSVTVYQDATVSASADNSQVCLNDVVNHSSSITGGSGSLTYQWQHSAHGTSGWTNISGATNASYSPSTSVAGDL